MSYTPTYDPIRNRSFKKDRCFLCGEKLDKTNYTEEHIFPRWLLNRLDLWNKKLVLLNRISRKYKKIKIPCCNKCNNVYLGSVEGLIEKASKIGYKEFVNLPKEKVFLWLQKICYEILYMELSLSFDPKDREGRTIIDEETLERYRMCHIFLQATRIKVKFHKPYPWSIFIVELQKYDQEKLNFDFKDNVLFLTVAIRIGDIGIIACLQDNNTQEQIFGDDFRKIKAFPLHPVQFNELVAQVFYKESLRNRTSKYIIFEGKEHLEINSMPLGGLSSKPIYDDWIQSKYAEWLSIYSGLNFNEIYKAPDKVMSFLYDDKQHFKKIDIKTCGF
jgi:hypothetical protein